MNKFPHRPSLRELQNDGEIRYGTFSKIIEGPHSVENAVRMCPECGAKLELDMLRSGVWGRVWACPQHGIINGPDIVYNDAEEDIAEGFSNGDMVKTDCPKCHGSGYTGAHDDQKCSKCDGTGIYYKSQNATGYRCQICLMETLDKSELDDHMRIAHERSNSNNDDNLDEDLMDLSQDHSDK